MSNIAIYPGNTDGFSEDVGHDKVWHYEQKLKHFDQYKLIEALTKEPFKKFDKAFLLTKSKRVSKVEHRATHKNMEFWVFPDFKGLESFLNENVSCLVKHRNQETYCDSFKGRKIFYHAENGRDPAKGRWDIILCDHRAKIKDPIKHKFYIKPVDPAVWKPGKEKYFDFVMVTRFKKEHSALEEILKSKKQLKIAIIGTFSPSKKALKNINRHEVKCFGWVHDPAEIAGIIGQSRLALPSVFSSDGFPNTILQCLMCNVPLVYKTNYFSGFCNLEEYYINDNTTYFVRDWLEGVTLLEKDPIMPRDYAFKKFSIEKAAESLGAI